MASSKQLKHIEDVLSKLRGLLNPRFFREVEKLMQPARCSVTNEFWVNAFKEEKALRMLIRKHPVLAEAELILYNKEVKKRLKGADLFRCAKCGKIDRRIIHKCRMTKKRKKA